jgi:hypothetical protein
LLSCGLHKDNLHQLVQKRRVILKVFQQSTFNHIVIAFGQLIQKDADLSNVAVELVDFAQGLLSKLCLPFFVGEIKQSHVNWAGLIVLAQTQHQLH